MILTKLRVVMNINDFNTEISSLLENRYKELGLTGLEKQFFAHLLQGGNDFSNIVMEKFPKIDLMSIWK